MSVVVDIFSLLTAVAGWYYMFYSRAAQKLAAIEDARLNAKRIILRKIGGGAMLLLAVFFFLGCQDRLGGEAFLAVWLAVLCLLAAIMLLALYDVRLTWKMRHDRRDRRP